MELSRTRRAGENTKIGGLALKILKKLNGDKLGFPFLSIVLANAIGLGAMALCKYPCNLAVEISLGLMVSMAFSFYKDMQWQWQFQKSMAKFNGNFNSNFNSNFKNQIQYLNAVQCSSFFATDCTDSNGFEWII
jgi:hypothetical protein